MSRSPQRLTDRHRFDFFGCGESDLDDWAVRHAHEDQRCGRSATHVWVDDGGEYVVGYFTLLPAVIRATDEGGIFQKVRPKRYQGREVAGVLVGKLALDQSLRGQGQGLELLADALWVAGEAMSMIGGVYVLVDPMEGRSELRAWYLDQGFQEMGDTNRLFLDIRS